MNNLNIEKIETEFSTNRRTGLAETEAEKKLRRYGLNEIPEKKRDSFFRKFIAELSDFMVLILIAAAAISLILSIIKGETDFTDPIIIMIIVLLNALLGVIQENKAEKAIDSLKNLTPKTVEVIRGGIKKIIPAEKLVPGDLISLSAGAFVPADCRVISATALSADESSLTGESIPAEKTSEEISKEEETYLKNCIYSGTVITSGKCTALVFATGLNSSIGKIASMLGDAEKSSTPLQKRLERMGKFLGIGALAVCFVVFLMGIFRGGNVFDMFMLSVSLAVAAIPEGLPSVVTIVLALGVRRMVRSNVVIKKLQSVESLGCAGIICSDKTGTLTKNEMTVTAVCSPESELSLTDKRYRELILYPILCNDASIVGESYRGSATDLAFFKLGEKTNLKKSGLNYKRLAEIPFDSQKKYSGVLINLPLGKIQIFKGAPDIILKYCTHFRDKSGKSVPFSSSVIKKTEHLIRSYAENGYRVIAAATKPSEILSAPSSLTFEGFFALIDPPRDEVKEAVLTCRRAGIRPVMITGDHLDTAKAIASSLHIYKEGDLALTGPEIEKMNDDKLQKFVMRCSVFARVSPEHKLRIVKAYQSHGQVVAMTGDGVNDAPALKKADIGCAMGIGGTDVAKNAADMVLLDDNFASIVKAVREGRGIFDNIRKAIHFLLSSNIGEILTIFGTFLIGLPTPLLPIQLLWINLITDSLPALALGTQEIEEDVMERNPRRAKENFINASLGFRMICEGVLIGLLSITAFVITLPISLDLARTTCFAVLCFSQLVHSFNVKSRSSIFKNGIFDNKYLVGAVLLCSSLMVSIISIPFLSNIFSLVPLSEAQWGIVFSFALIPIIFDEIFKKIKKPK